MRVLLSTLNSKYVHTNLAIKYLYGIGIENCPGLEIKEFTINSPEDYVYTEIIRGRYDVVCFSCYVWNVEKTKYICENLKKADSGLKIILGGPEVSYDVRNFLEENPYVDAIMFGEGEAVFFLLTNAFETGYPTFPEIKGLAYRAGDKVFVNEPMPLYPMEFVPFPYEKLPLEEDKVVYYESSRGCPFGCTYCMSSIDTGVRALALERVKDELQYFLYKRVKQVKFIDRTFNWNEKRAVEIMNYLIANDNGVTNFHFEICASLIGEAFLDAADRARPDLFQFEIGMQTTNPMTQRAINRNDNVVRSLVNIRKLSEIGGARLHIDLIAGLPYESIESFRISFNNIYPAGADMIQLGFLKLLKGTAIRKDSEGHDYVYRSQAPYEVISNRYMEADELVEIKKMDTVLDLFYNRGGFYLTLGACIDRMDTTPFDFYKELADFYYIKGYHECSHSKEDMYRIMYEFLQWRAGVYETSVAFEVECLEKDLRDRLCQPAVDTFLKKGWNFTKE